MHISTESKLQFREAMSTCAAAVYVVTTDGIAGRDGITMTAISAVTDEPPTLMLCVNRQARVYPILLKNKILCINVLSEEQRDVAEHFAGIGKLTPNERFARHIWQQRNHGQWQLQGALAHFVGRIIQHQVIGTHGVFFVEVEAITNDIYNQTALIYFRRKFHGLENQWVDDVE